MARASGTANATSLMNDIMNFTAKNFPEFSILLSAQTYLVEFYKSYGFKVEGDNYLEDGIEHINMALK